MWILDKVVDAGSRKTICFKKLAMEWIEIKRNTVKHSTYCNYKFIVEKYLISNLEKLNLKKLEKFNYNKFIQDLAKTLSQKTTRDIVNVLKAILMYAGTHYGLAVNVQGIYAPRVDAVNIKVLTRREQGRLERYCMKQGTLTCLGIVISLKTGLRIGEVCALKWEDIDLDGRNIYVKKTLQRVYNGKDSKVIIDSPKTRSSVRAIPISDKLYAVLQPMKKTYSKDAFFLTGEEDKFFEPRRYQYYYKLILKACKVKQYKYHILRHTFATNCIEVGMDAKSLSEILGHANVNITLSRYVHSSYKMKKKYLEKLK